MKCLFVLVAIAVCFSAYAASDSRSGAWTAELDGDALQLTIFRGNQAHEGYRYQGNVMGFNEALGSFSGLSKNEVASNAANVKFELRRVAGTIAFDGRFSDGTGAGHFHFTPSDAFVRDMETLGYSGFTDDELLVFAAHDFSPQTIRDLRSMGYQPTKREVEEIAVFRITAEVIKDFGRLGYSNLSLRDLVDLRVGRVDAEYISSMRALGFKDLSARQIADMAILGVRPSYIRDLQAAGLTGLTSHELDDLRVGNITAARIEEYRRLGYANLSARQLSEMGIQGVTPKYIEELRALGYDKLTIQQLLEMKIFGVTPDYIRKMKSLGYNNVPPDKLVKLKMSGLVR